MALLITFIAGFSTVLGALFVRKTRHNSLFAFALAFATGIMLTIAFTELFPQSAEVLGIVSSVVLLVVGASLSLILDVVLPHHHEHEEEKVPGHFIEDCECAHEDHVSSAMIIALLLHNVLEGFATGITAMSDLRLGINMALGIAIHNIPIGTTLAVSLISSGKSKGSAVFKTALVGLSQPLGALAGILLVEQVSPSLVAAFNCIVAGVLIYISFDELWPAARKNGSRNLTIFALLAGICFISLSELIIG